MIVVSFQVLLRNFSRGIQKNHEKNLSGYLVFTARFEEYASQTHVRKVAVGKNKIAQIRNQSLQRPTTDLCAVPVDSSLVQSLIILLTHLLNCTHISQQACSTKALQTHFCISSACYNVRPSRNYSFRLLKYISR